MTAVSTKAIGSIDLYAEEAGTGDPLVLIHGFANSTYVWRHVVPRLAQNHKVIAVDLKGFGRSPKPLDAGYSIYDQALLIHNFIVARNLQNVTLVGHSYGGGVALITSLYIMRYKTISQRSLILIDSIAYPQKLPWFIRILAAPVVGPLVVRLVPAKAQVRSVMRLAYYDKTMISEAAVRAYAATLETPGGRHATVATARRIQPPDLPELSNQYPRITVTTLIIWGRHDKIVPIEIGRRLKAALPASQLYIIDDCGHSPAEERPEQVLFAIESFLKTVT